MRKVFISYARANRAQVDKLVEHLGVLGCQTWIDSSLHGGQQWWDEILDQIAGCDVFLPVISLDALNSSACQREFDWAEALDRPVLPIAVEPLPKALPRRFSLRQIVDYSDPAQGERAALTLAGALATLPAAPALPDPMPAPPAPPLSYLTDLVELASGKNPLDHEQQRQLLFQLEPALRSVDPYERQGGLNILEVFSSRDNLYADVDRRLAWLKANTVAPGTGPTAPPTQSAPRRRTPTTTGVQHATPSGVPQTPVRRKRGGLKLALIATSVVVVIGVVIAAYSLLSGSGGSQNQIAQPAAGQPGAQSPGSGQIAGLAPASGQPAQPGSSAGSAVVLPFTGLNRPVGVAVDVEGAVYVTDSQNNRVVKLAGSSYNQTVMSFSGLNNPQGVAIGREGLVFVTDADNSRVLWPKVPRSPAAPPWQAVSSTEWVGPFSGLHSPYGVFSDNYPNFWVADSGNNRVLKWSSGTNAPEAVPFTGLNNPGGVASWNPDGSTYVVDSGNNRVLMLKNPNSPQMELSFSGLNNPQGVAVSPGVLYVTDSGNNRVLKLTVDRDNPTGFSATPSVLPFAGLNNPRGVAVDGQGNLYVVDTDNNRVLKLAKAFLGQ